MSWAVARARARAVAPAGEEKEAREPLAAAVAEEEWVTVARVLLKLPSTGGASQGVEVST